MACDYPNCPGGEAGTHCKSSCREPAALLTTWVSETEAVTEPLFKAPPPPRRLTDAEISEIWFAAAIPGLTETSARLLIRAAERRLGVGNG